VSVEGGGAMWPTTSLPAEPSGRRQPAVPGRDVPLRPLTIADTLDSVVVVLRRGAAPVAVIVLAVVWPDLLVREAAIARLAPVPTTTVDPEVLLTAYAAGAPWWLLNIAVALFISAVVSGGLVALFDARDHGVALGARDALLRGLRRSGAVLGATLLGLGAVGVLAFATVIAATVLGIVLPVIGFLLLLPVLLVLVLLGFVVSFLVVPVAVVEWRGPWRSFVRTLELIRRGNWRLLAVTALVLVLLLAIAVSLLVAGALLVDLLGAAGWILEVLGGALLAAIATPLLAAAGFVVHRDVRVRAEGFDLVVRAQARRFGT